MIKKKLFTALVSLLVSLLLVELLLRILPPLNRPIEWDESVFNDKRYKRNDLKWLEENVQLNKFGYRDNEISLQKSENVTRMFVVGDSFTYGWYIDDQSQSYPNLLEQKLNNSSSQIKYEVINAANPGFSAEDSIQRATSQAVFFNPDYIFLTLNPYDIVPTLGSPTNFPDIPTLENTKIYNLVKKLYQSRETKQRTTNSIKKIAPQINELNNLSKKIGSRLVVIILPEFDPARPNAPYLYSNVHKEFANSLEKLSINLIDLLEESKKVKEKKMLVLNPRDSHPSIYANQITARTIINEVDLSHQAPQLTLKEDRLNNIDLNNTLLLKAKPPWVIFDLKHGLEPMTIFTEDKNSDRQLSYYQDSLASAKANTHTGWIGAKLEYNVTPGTNFIKNELYGFQVVGISKIKTFTNINGNLASQDLSPEEITIQKRSGGFYININQRDKYSLIKISLDLAVNQVDLMDNKVVQAVKTELVMQKDQPKNLLRLPTFTYGTQNTNYGWDEDYQIFTQNIVELAEQSPKIEFYASKKFNQIPNPEVVYLKLP